MTFTDAATTEEFLDRYLQVWHEPDPATRKELVRLLWTDDAVQYTDANEYRGHEALAARVAAAYDRFVQEGKYVFRPQIDPATHHGALLIALEMVPKDGGEPAWLGTIIAFVDGDGRIEREYQFGRNA
jgi:hypothetical protein